MGIISQQLIRENLEMLPCPKCGEIHAITLWDADDESEDGETYWKVVCAKCYIQTKPHRSKHSAVKDWNTRSESPNAEQLALKEYPVKLYPGSEIDMNEMERIAYLKGLKK